MNFFEAQQQARKATRLLVALFALAVVAIVLAVYLAVAIFGFRSSGGLWDPKEFVGVAILTSGVIAAGSLYKMAELGSGGESVARLLGGKPIDPNTSDAAERRVRNVVEEMAIASGTPVPTVFVLGRERGINAFAAGLTPADAVIGVTRGCVSLLTREELQGVIAHEFSHILNGDMRLNLRMMGLLHGIQLIWQAGYWMLRASAGGESRRSGKSSGGGVGVLGVALLVVGSIGLFFARLIKSAVSRQREYLGDAAAVQFTRNPAGLGGALKKIGGLGAGSRIWNPWAEQTSHLFFAEGVARFFGGLLATHPPLRDRIQRLDPAFDGTYPKVEMLPEPPPLVLPPVGRAAETAARVAFALENVGSQHLAYAGSLVRAVPGPVREALREPSGAPAVVLGLLAGARPDGREELGKLRGSLDPAIEQSLETTLPLLAGAPMEARLPLLNLALPALRRMSPAQYRSFREAAGRLIRQPGAAGVFEFALERVLFRQLDPRYASGKPSAKPAASPLAIGPSATILLSLLASSGRTDAAAAGRAYARGAAVLARTGAALERAPRLEAGLADLGKALDALGGASPRLKQTLVEACAAAVAEDGRVSVEEGESLRAIAEALDSPVPPLLPGQPLS